MDKFRRSARQPEPEPDDEPDVPLGRPAGLSREARRPAASASSAKNRAASVSGSKAAAGKKGKSLELGNKLSKMPGLARDKISTFNPREKLQEFHAWVEGRRAMAVVEPERIEPGRRIMALGIDFGAAFVCSMFVMMLPLVNRVIDQNFVLLALMCVRDYFYSGRGLGKNIMGLKVVDMFTGQAPDIRAVLKRNLIYLGPLLFMEALHLILGLLPLPAITYFLGQTFNALATLYVLVILPLECYRSYQREDSMRLGDEIAGTCILESETDFSGFLPKTGP